MVQITTEEIEQTRMAAHATLEEAEGMLLDLVGLLKGNAYVLKAYDAVEEALEALSDLAEEITGASGETH